MTVSSAVESSLLTPPAGRASASVPADRSPLHLRKEFAITVHAPLDVAVGFFGAHGERVWAGKDWDPQFLNPQSTSAGGPRRRRLPRAHG